MAWSPPARQRRSWLVEQAGDYATFQFHHFRDGTPKAIESALRSAGFTLLYLPRYSPDLSPIEPGWSKLKSSLRTAEARTAEALETALAPALDSITPADARGWFDHCGYSFPN